MSERNIFNALRSCLVCKRLSYRAIFWIIGCMSFCLSPVIDNLTTALVMCAAVLAIGRGNSRLITVGCINFVIAANAGDAFSPFRDITTLTVWQHGLTHFQTFFELFDTFREVA